MHPRNPHHSAYPFAELCSAIPELTRFVIKSQSGRKTIDFADANAVKLLNAALLKHYYNVGIWNIPEGYLCPPVPGRADYIHALADFLGEDANIDLTKKVTALDIGTGANLIYPIIGSQAYGWHFVGTDIDQTAVKSASLIQSSNPNIKNQIKVRHQPNADKIFSGVIQTHEFFTFSMCNPPFHASQQAAMAGTIQKNANLNRHRQKRGTASATDTQRRAPSRALNTLNFAGQANELWCHGGELGFIKNMIRESVEYKTQIRWFTSLVSKKESLRPIELALKQSNVAEFTRVNMQQGNKMSRFIAWRF